MVLPPGATIIAIAFDNESGAFSGKANDNVSCLVSTSPEVGDVVLSEQPRNKTMHVVKRLVSIYLAAQISSLLKDYCTITGDGEFWVYQHKLKRSLAIPFVVTG